MLYMFNCCPRYRMHQPNKKGTKAWYRCVKYESNQCRATAVLHISSKTLLKVTRSHTHSPGFLQEFARLDIRIYLQVYIHWSALWIRIRILLCIRIRIILLSCKNRNKNLHSYYLVTAFDFLSLKNDVNVASKSNRQNKLG